MTHRSAMPVTQRRRDTLLLRYPERVCQGTDLCAGVPPNPPGAGDKHSGSDVCASTQLPEGATTPAWMGMAVTEAALPLTAQMPEQCITHARHSYGPSFPHSKTKSGPIHPRRQEATPSSETGSVTPQASGTPGSSGAHSAPATKPLPI